MKRITLDGVVLYKNPFQKDVTTYSKIVPQIRGIIIDDNLYIWDAYDATHNDIDKQLNPCHVERPLPGKYIDISIISVDVKESPDLLWKEEGYIGGGPNFKVFMSDVTPIKKNHPSIIRLIKMMDSTILSRWWKRLR